LATGTRLTLAGIVAADWKHPKKKGDFKKNGKDDVGGNEKQDNSTNTDSRTGNQNAGHGGHS
jgi:hypothetical protein